MGDKQPIKRLFFSYIITFLDKKLGARSHLTFFFNQSILQPLRKDKE